MMVCLLNVSWGIVYHDGMFAECFVQYISSYINELFIVVG